MTHDRRELNKAISGGDRSIPRRKNHISVNDPSRKGGWRNPGNEAVDEFEKEGDLNYEPPSEKVPEVAKSV
jgi:hypothetical protein